MKRSLISRLAAVLGVALFGKAAAGSPPPGTPPPQINPNSPANPNAAEPEWTPERMRAAKPVDMGRPAPGERKPPSPAVPPAR